MAIDNCNILGFPSDAIIPPALSFSVTIGRRYCRLLTCMRMVLAVEPDTANVTICGVADPSALPIVLIRP